MSYKLTEDQAQEAVVQCYVAMKRMLNEHNITECMLYPEKQEEWTNRYEFYEKQIALLKIKFPQFWRKRQVPYEYIEDMDELVNATSKGEIK